MSGESTVGWPFLIARGRSAGYQLLLVPSFMVATGEAALLMDEVQGEVPIENPPVVVNIAGPIGGSLCAVYRTIRATRGDVGATDRVEEPLLDRAGRPLVLAYGFICRGSQVVAPHEEDLRTARDAALATYQRFHAAEATFLPETSRPYVARSILTPVETAASGSSASRPPASVEAAPTPGMSRSPEPWTSQVLPDSQPPPPPPPIARRLVVALLLLGLAVGAYLLFAGRSVPQVKVPNVVKMETRDAEQRITNGNLTWSISCQNTKPPGVSIDRGIIGTKPPAGKWVNKGSKVIILAYPCPS